MKNKDYVGAKNSRKKRAPARAQQDAPVKRPFPWMRLLIIVVLVSLFAGGLMYIQNDSQDFNAEHVTPIPKPKKAKQKALPPPPADEEWEFIEELENKSVNVETEELEDKGPFKMQCASFRSETDAQKLKAKIAFAGFESQVSRSEGTSGTWYKVVLGPFDRKRDAEKTRHILKRNDIRGCQIWLWR